jgi:hypothetical protein
MTAGRDGGLPFAGSKPGAAGRVVLFSMAEPAGQVLHDPGAGSPATRARGHNRGEFVFGGNMRITAVW